jgi:hypothetical protein
MIKSNYFILRCSQIGNVGAHQIQRIKEQPEDGFESELEAENHLTMLLLKTNGTFSYPWDAFTIMKLYIPPQP